MQNPLSKTALGKLSEYPKHYDPSLLFAISRQIKRDEIHVPHTLPFSGYDLWNAYELSWLNDKGKPVVARATFIFPCESPYLIESKSFKLYLNSLNQTIFESTQHVQEQLISDLSECSKSNVEINLITSRDFSSESVEPLKGFCLDDNDITCNTYTIESSYLKTLQKPFVEETVYSDLLKSNCPVTGQPDWASIQIDYRGKPIDHAGLLQYIVSYRNNSEFHEQCVERIFMDILKHCEPQKLTVYARYTRRGGLDINPLRSTERTVKLPNFRHHRQ